MSEGDDAEVLAIADWMHTNAYTFQTHYHTDRPNDDDWCGCRRYARGLVAHLSGRGIILVRDTAMSVAPVVERPASEQVRIGCMMCDAVVILPPVLDAASRVQIIDGQMRVSIHPLAGWEFGSETGWRCPEHVPVRGGTNPAEGVKDDPDPPSDVRTF